MAYYEKITLATLLAIMRVLILSAGLVVTAHCYLADKPDGAGNIGDVIIDVSGGSPTVTEPTNPGGQTAGGFVDVYLDVDGNGTGDILLVDDAFLLPSNSNLIDPADLPDGTPDAAGNGRGVDE